ncbi:MAG: VOC family protein [Bacteroidetes bacterium]|nr:VOC family protein [Bacteroidota bacterium]
MLTAINPKLPMRDKAITRDFYIQLGFRQFGGDYPHYLMLELDAVQIHFFLFTELDPKENYGQVYIRTDDIDEWYQTLQGKGVVVNRPELKPWGQKECSLLDPDNNLLTFGQST